MRRDYADFDLVFHRDEAGSYSAEVSNSPVGEAARPFEVPFSDQDLEIFLLRMGHARGSSRRVDTPELKATRTFGRRLYGAVFGGRVGTLLERSLDEADRNEQGLRVRLHLSETPELADLPWEFVYSEELGRFLATSTETPVVRYMDLPRRVRPLTISPPLRILVMISSPSDHSPLNVDSEWRRLKAALHDLGNRGLVELSKVQDGSLQSLQQELRRDEYHVLHYIGHGAFDETIDDGVLILEDERQRGRRVGGEDLGMILHDHRSLRLAVLNSCEGARSSRSDPFSGTGKSLVQQGIPAVVAMQFEISDEAAIQFAREFYEALADGYPVDAAMGEARKALFGGGIEWGTPVLYMRAPDGRIFDVESAAAVVDESQADPRQAVDTRRVAGLFGMAHISIDEEDWSTAVSRLEDVLRLDPSHAEAHEALGTARAQERIARMYGGARLLFEAGQWQAVIDRVEQIRLVEPTFDDPEELELRARNTLVEEERAGRLAEWYREATAAFEAAEWETSMELLGRIADESPGYKDTQEIITQASAHHQSEQLLTEAGEAIEEERWQAAVDRFTEMEQLGTDYLQDPQGWRQLAIDRIEEEQQERRLDALYDTALALVEGEGWDEASKIIDKIESERPGYRGIDRFRTRIKEAHARLVEEERLREIEHEPVVGVPAEEAPVEEPVEETPVEEESVGGAPAPKWRLGLPAIAIVTVGTLVLALVVALLVVPGLVGDTANEDGVAAVASTPASTAGPVPDDEEPARASPVGATEVEREFEAIFDADHTSDALSLQNGGDVDTEMVAAGSPQERAWRSGNGRALIAADGNTSEDWYIQFQVDDDFMVRGSPTSQVMIEVEFLDEGVDMFNIQYDSSDASLTGPARAFKDSEFVTKTGTGEFKTAVFVLSDAFFTNRTNGGDFRIADQFDGAETIRRVTVTLLLPSDRVIALYYTHWGTATADGWCCEYFPQHVVGDWNDSQQLEQHFAWLHQARVGVVAYSWSGRGSGPDNILPAILDAADSYGIEVAFVLEGYETRSPATLAGDVEYIYDRYGKHPAFYWTTEPTLWQQNDQPKGLFFLWGPSAGADEGRGPEYWRPAVSAIHDLDQGGVVLGGDVDRDWIEGASLDGLFSVPDPYLDDFSWATELPAGAWYVPGVLVGFEQEIGVDPYADLPRREGGVYGQWWEGALGASVRPNRVIIGSFNHWSEGSQIEPVATGVTNDQGLTYKDYGDLGPEGYLEMTAEWVAELLERFP